MSLNALKRKRPTRGSASSSSPSVTTPPNHPSLSPMPSSSHTSGPTVTVRRPTLPEPVEQYHNIMADSSITPIVSARPPVKYVYRPEPVSTAPSTAKYVHRRTPPLSCGLLRGTPAALSGVQDMYYSERSYPTPMAAPSPDAIAAEIDKFRSFQAALSATGTAETAAQKRRRKAEERVFAYRREATYHILKPEYKNMSKPEAPLSAVLPPTPRLSLRSTPPISSPVPVAQSIGERTEPLAAPPLREQSIKLEESNVEMLEYDDRIEAPESTKEYSDDEENYEGAEPTGYTESSNDDEDNYDDMDTYEFTEEWSDDDDDEDENSTIASKTPDRDQEEFRMESANTEVMTVTKAMSAAETESQRSTPVEHSDTDSDGESNYSNFSDEYQVKRETRSKSKSKQTKRKSRSTSAQNIQQPRGLSSDQNSPAQNNLALKPVSSIPFPRLGKGVNLHGYSQVLLPIPRVVKQEEPLP